MCDFMFITMYILLFLFEADTKKHLYCSNILTTNDLIIKTLTFSIKTHFKRLNTLFYAKLSANRLEKLKKKL